MFRSNKKNLLELTLNVIRKLSSYFCFRRKPLLNESTQAPQEVDTTLVDINTERDKLSEDYETLKEKNLEVSKRLNLVSSLLSAEPLYNSGLSKFREILNGDFMDFANEESALAEEAKAVLLMQEIERDLETIVAYPDIFSKTIIVIAGGFSSGKSQLVNSFIHNNDIQLPIDMVRTTAIPTYIVSNNSESITGFASGGGTVKLNPELYGKLSYSYLQSFGFNLRDIMPYIAIGTLMDQAMLEHICLVDTPGYNPADSDKHSNNDEQVALEHLRTAHSLIWVIGLDSNGTIPKSDRDFLDKIDLTNKNLFILASKADLRPLSDLKNILEEIKDTIESLDIPYEGISAYSSEKNNEYHIVRQSLTGFLKNQNTSQKTRDSIIKKITAVFKMYEKATEEKIKYNKSIKSTIHSLELDLQEMGIEDEPDTEEQFEKINGRINSIRKMVDTKEYSENLKRISKLKEAMINAVDELLGEIESA